MRISDIELEKHGYTKIQIEELKKYWNSTRQKLLEKGKCGKWVIIQNDEVKYSSGKMPTREEENKYEKGKYILIRVGNEVLTK